jgi:hypothetical protein
LVLFIFLSVKMRTSRLDLPFPPFYCPKFVDSVFFVLFVVNFTFIKKKNDTNEPIIFGIVVCVCLLLFPLC